MAYAVRRIDYFYITVAGSPGLGFDVLSQLADQGINLVAITSVPAGPDRTQLTVFPDDSTLLRHVAEQAGIPLDGPHQAFVVQGDDEVGALATVHEKLVDANVHVFATTGVADGKGGYGYVIYVRPDDCDLAARALDV